MARVLVTGASRGIGRELCARLVAGGHSVVGLVRSSSSVAGLGLSDVVEADLLDLDGVAAALSGLVTAEAEPFDGLVHCAGVVRAGALADTTPADFRDQFEVNVVAAAEVTRLVLPSLRRSALPTAVFVNSGSGQNAREPLAAYGASKFAVRGYVDALRQAEPWLRVCTLYPGRTATDMQVAVRSAEGGSFEPDDYLAVSTVASVIETMLLLPGDGVLTEVTLRPF